MTTTGDRLKSARESAGLSVRDLAGKVGLDHSMIVKVESGRKGLSRDSAKKVARALKIPVDDLLAGETLPATPAPAAAAPANAVREWAPAGDGVVTMLDYAALQSSPLNPRKHFDEEALRELADNIATTGLLQNLVARPHPKKPGRYELAAGERRYRAIGLLINDGRWPTDRKVPVQVRALDDLQLLFLGVGENVQRQTMHPIEEGAAFVALVKESADRAEATRQIAKAFGKTPRWVQLRMALDEKLAEPVKAAFLEGKIGLEDARAFTLGDTKTQAAFYNANKHTDMNVGWVRRSMTAKMIPVGRNHFKEADYKGEIVEDGERRYFADPAAFLELQSAAISATIGELQKKWAWVERRDGQSLDLYNYAKSKDPKKAGAIVAVGDDHQVTIHTGLVKPRPMTPTKTKATAKPAAGGRAADPVEEEDAEPWTKTHLCEAKRRKTAALQTAIVEAGEACAMRLAILALLGAGSAVHIRAETHRPEDRVLAGPVRKVLRGFEHDLGLSIPEKSLHGSNPYDLNIGYYGDEEREADLWERLTKMHDERIKALFVAMIAARCGSFNGLKDPRIANDLPAAAIAETLGLEHGGNAEGDGPFVADDVWLKTYKRAGLVEAAIDSGVYQKDAREKLMATGLGVIREAMISSTVAHPGWVPMELHFQRPADAGDDQEGEE